MKTRLRARATIAALALVTWLLVPQAGYCFYNPNTGRWISRDPVGETGGMNVLGFVLNRPTSRIDPDGRIPIEGPAPVVR